MTALTVKSLKQRIKADARWMNSTTPYYARAEPNLLKVFGASIYQVNGIIHINKCVNVLLDYVLFQLRMNVSTINGHRK